MHASRRPQRAVEIELHEHMSSGTSVSVHDRPSPFPHPAVVEKADAGDAEDDALQGEYTWYIENFSKNKQAKLYSPVFQSGQYNWCAAH